MDFQKQIDEFNGLAKKKKHLNAFYGSIKKDCLKVSETTVCHSGIGYPDPNIVYYISSVQKPAKNIPEWLSRRYIKWLVEKSPWSSFIVNEDGDEAYENSILFKGDTPTNVVKSACIASRYTTENHGSYLRIPYGSLIWNALVERGLDPHLAFMCSHLFSPEDYRKTEKLVFVASNPVSWHHCVNPYVEDEEYVLNFLNHKINKDNMVSDLWGNAKRNSKNGLWARNLVPRSARFTDNFNLFKRANKGNLLFTEDDLEDIVAEFQRYIYNYDRVEERKAA